MAVRAAVAAVASGLQVVKRVRFGMRGPYIGELVGRRGTLTCRGTADDRKRREFAVVRGGRTVIV
ncbi:hypothetical protein GCM10010451_27490 [Streptomyces virens]|uniref:Uncharacterized protein n=1 Tax=Streptomyces virens TaxID=285572 RepID=A0ABP6PEV4_9ACTN|nr:hypothetical protein GCM10010247_58620 [Streptomyces calvus]